MEAVTAVMSVTTYIMYVCTMVKMATSLGACMFRKKKANVLAKMY